MIAGGDAPPNWQATHPDAPTLARKALAAVADWWDQQPPGKPPTVPHVWSRIHGACEDQVRAAELRFDCNPDSAYPQALGEAFRLLRVAADCRYQQYLDRVLQGERKRGTLGGTLRRAATATNGAQS